jgi:tetratricopeptide (TPR) repeat protein
MGAKELTVQTGYKLAACLAGLRRRPEAIDLYQAILKKQSGNSQIAANLASLLERENRLDEAASWTDKALVMDPANETARMTRATLAPAPTHEVHTACRPWPGFING